MLDFIVYIIFTKYIYFELNIKSHLNIQGTNLTKIFFARIMSWLINSIIGIQ